MFDVRDEVEIKVLILHRIFVYSFHGNEGRIMSYVTFVAVENTGKKTNKMGILINASCLMPRPPGLSPWMPHRHANLKKFRTHQDCVAVHRAIVLHVFRL